MAEPIDTDVTPIAWDPESGSYRIVRKRIEKVTIGGIEQSFETDELGGRVVWVDDAPEDREDGSGHFERDRGAEENYEPRRAAE